MNLFIEDAIVPIDKVEAITFLLPRHYSGRIPPISFAFGWYVEGDLKAVATFGEPASPQLTWCCGIENKDKVLELNRLCREADFTEPLSKFVAWCLRWLKPYNLIIVSFADTEMNHHGYIYQAVNAVYTGITKERTDKYVSGGKHSRHYTEEEQGKFRKVRSAKHRYILFACDKRHKREYLAKLKYSVLPYPKGDNNADYILGEFLKERIIEC